MHPKRHAEYQNKMPSKRSKLDNSSDFMDESTNSPQNSIEEVTGKMEISKLSKHLYVYSYG